MKFVIDVNLSPDWAGPIQSLGHAAVPWSRVGADDASDREIMTWARQNAHAVLTKDLDFGAELSRTGVAWPSVVQLRMSVVDPALVGPRVLQDVTDAIDALRSGALLVISDRRSRARRLPLSRLR